MSIPNSLIKKDQLVKGVEALEANNDILSLNIKELKTSLEDKRKTNQSLIAQLKSSKQNFADPIAESKFLQNNIDFLNSEKKRLTIEYHELKKDLDGQLINVDKLLKDLGFIKGEIGTLLVQIGMLEEELPMKLRDAKILDEKISKSFFSMVTELHDNVTTVSNKAKSSYYKNLKESETIRSSLISRKGLYNAID
ncbi:magnetosome protein Mad24-2 [Candidatus Magnetomorum sp. HK-1]|nr:magnetosome protein Mad24-2 [Candidatus Magnetomorum sp. HK-1]